ncbi:MAG TPA: phospholipid carrier-dependent glycosyltransferase [Candidatus Woesearchaeota archaeon]|nr:phospholipid carrier-dependent glycosyltransferase [Candidatus Woesearchaeota archaeon]
MLRKAILLLILVYGFILRIAHLGYQSMWLDETISAAAAKGILEHGYPLLQSGAAYTRALLFHYGMAFFIWIFREDFGARLISVIFGVLTIWLAYIFAKKFIKTTFPRLAFPLLIALSTAQIIYSRQARFYQAFLFFYFLSFYLFYTIIIKKEALFRKQWKSYALLIASLAFTMHIHLMGYILIPLFFIIYLMHNLARKTLRSPLTWAAAIAITAFSAYLILRLSPTAEMIALYSFRYYRAYFSQLALLLFALAGLIISIYKNPKPHASIALISLTPFLGLFFIREFATRYAYFLTFPLMLYVAALFKEAKFRYILLAVFIAFMAPSVFTLTPFREAAYDPSMPLADYKGAAAFLSTLEEEYPVAVTWSPAAAWYGYPADYQLNYSLSGLGHGFWRPVNGRERFANAIVVNSQAQLPEEYILVMDAQGARKLPAGNYNFTPCETLFKSYDISVALCKSP